MFDEIFIENLVEDHMIKVDEFANFTEGEPMTRDYPGVPAFIETYYVGEISIDDNVFSDEQINTIYDLIELSYLKYRLQQDLLSTMKSKGVPVEVVENLDTIIFDEADVNIKIENSKIVCEVSYDGDY